MPAPARSTRRAPAAASARFHAASVRRSNAVAWLLGGIGGAFALALAYILVGGSPPVDTLPDQVAELEAKIHQREADGLRAEAIQGLHELLRIAGGRETYRTRAMEWRGSIKRLEGEMADLRKADAAFAAFEKEAAAPTRDTARDLWQKGTHLREAYAGFKRPWLPTLEAILKALERLMAPSGPKSWIETRQTITDACRLEARGEAQWGEAVRRWAAYLKEKLGESDRQGAEGARRLVEQRAREEAVSLGNRNLPADDLRKHLPRFQGTAAEALLQKALGGK